MSGTGIKGSEGRPGIEDADIAGQINVDGKEYWINGWQKKNGQDGSTFYSLSVKPKQPRRQDSDDSDQPF